MPPKKGPKAPGGLTLTRAIGPQDIKLLNKLTSDPGGAGIFSSIGLTSCQLEELGRFNFNSWEDLVKKTGVNSGDAQAHPRSASSSPRLDGS